MYKIYGPKLNPRLKIICFYDYFQAIPEEPKTKLSGLNHIKSQELKKKYLFKIILIFQEDLNN